MLLVGRRARASPPLDGVRNSAECENNIIIVTVVTSIVPREPQRPRHRVALEPADIQGITETFFNIDILKLRYKNNATHKFKIILCV